MKKPNTKKLINQLLNKPVQVFEKFHEKTKINIFKKSEKNKKIPESWKTIFYKSYPRLPQIFLPSPKKTIVSLDDALQGRASASTFGEKPVTIEELSTFLHFTFGLRDETSGSRYYPSAGARYPIEAYLITLNSDLPAALYHYNIKPHALELLLPITNLNVNKYFADYSLMATAGCILILTAVFDRTIHKYGNRGYRHTLQEAGCILEIAYLISNAISLNICAVGGYKDDSLHTLLDIDGLHESIVGVFIFGQKR